MPALTPAEKTALRRAVSVHGRAWDVISASGACPGRGARALRRGWDALCERGVVAAAGPVAVPGWHPLVHAAWSSCACHPFARAPRSWSRRPHSPKGASSSAMGLCAQLEFVQCQRSWPADLQLEVWVSQVASSSGAAALHPRAAGRAHDSAHLLKVQGPTGDGGVSRPGWFHRDAGLCGLELAGWRAHGRRSLRHIARDLLELGDELTPLDRTFPFLERRWLTLLCTRSQENVVQERLPIC